LLTKIAEGQDKGSIRGTVFSLTINTPQDTVRIGSEIRLMIKLTNTTNHDIKLIDTDQYCDYTVEVLGSNGRSAPETEKKRKLRCTRPVAAKVIFVNLKPGEHYEVLVFVSDLFYMTSPGDYTLRVSREIPKELGHGRVESNTIRIAVTKEG
jgi:hypothetical protein